MALTVVGHSSIERAEQGENMQTSLFLVQGVMGSPPETMCFNKKKSQKKENGRKGECKVGMSNPLHFALFKSQTMKFALLKHKVDLMLLTYQCCVATAAT